MTTDKKWYVYLLCFDRLIGTDRGNARHYVGMTDDIPARLQTHRDGNGAKILRSLIQNYKGAFDLVRVWEFDTREEAWHREQHLKKNSMQTRYCPTHGKDYLEVHAKREAIRRMRRRRSRYGKLVKEIQEATTEEEATALIRKIRATKAMKET